MSLTTKYQQTQITTSPRQAEYRLMTDVTRALMAAQGGPRNEKYHHCVHWNLRMWLAFQEDVADDDNRLPDQLRAGIISLSLWVERETFKALRGEVELDDLIEINRTVMAGLAN